LPADDPANALLDPAGDGVSSLAEYRSGTEPFDPLSRLEVRTMAKANAVSATEITFLAVSNRTDAVQSREMLGCFDWQRFADVPAAPTNRMVTLEDPGRGLLRFYRLVTPWAP
jgi:hypothetical protein